MKKIILITIIVVGFGGALVMAIMAMTAGESTDSIVETTDDTGAPIAPLSAILPEGKTLDFSKVEEFNKDGLLFPFPEVSPQEIGADLGTIIE